MTNPSTFPFYALIAAALLGRVARVVGSAHGRRSVRRRSS